MTRHAIAILVAAALSLAACVPGRTGAGPVPRTHEISRAEIQAAGAANAFDLVQALRPDWLLLADRSLRDTTVELLPVYLGGRMLGDVSALRTLALGGIEAIRLQGPAWVLERERRLVGDIKGAIVVYPVSRPTAQLARWRVSAGAGLALLNPAHALPKSAQKAGYDEFWTAQWSDPGTRRPAAFHADVHYRLRPLLSVGADVQHTPPAWYGGYLLQESGFGTLSTSFTSTELAVQVLYGRLARVSLGPALRVTQWDWRSGLCQCEEPARNTTAALGLAASVGANLPASTRVFADASIRVRYYPSQGTGEYRHSPSLDAGGVVVVPAVGLGIRF